MLRKIAAFSALAALCGPAFAHPGHDHTYASHSLLEMPAGLSGIVLPLLALSASFGLALVVNLWASRQKPARRTRQSRVRR